MLSHAGVIGAAGVAAGGGSTLLVGDSNTPSGFDQVGGNQFYYTALLKTAVASGTPATILVYIGDSLVASNIVAAIYDSSNAKIAESAATAIVANSWVSCAVTGSPGSITSGQGYRIGFVANGYANMGRRTTAWESAISAISYPSTPSTIDPNNQSAAASEPAVYVMS